MSLLNYGKVIKRNNEDFVIFPDFEDSAGYNVVPKEVDEYNKYDIDDVRLYCRQHPDKVTYEENTYDDIGEAPEDVVIWLGERGKIRNDMRYLKKTDDVGYQLSRHERGTQILSNEKYEKCIEVDKTRGLIASGLKQRKIDLKTNFKALKDKYTDSELRYWGVI